MASRLCGTRRPLAVVAITSPPGADYKVLVNGQFSLLCNPTCVNTAHTVIYGLRIGGADVLPEVWGSATTDYQVLVSTTVTLSSDIHVVQVWAGTDGTTNATAPFDEVHRGG